ncbi:LON peptidase N-terminal domain and RING finger protein C14F5.10c [Schizosaccharomyces pombe]|uniref:LON peptidase N-terminal domain and RING finger protein C14F5.10c n=1 Tax=Schizosaccharomyces pombe (strain 972 / ATCC 24843) TaxID=284812 RepID=YOXA_SCHPO|nr:putative ubiquitin-protein ligase E3 [Schizosaccharomyces pombe]O60106.1 RecName: Full=LON peptidase N-terminal domain and RING finger protein C14F5.10c [Schizosaccharomyces pombe 972h-]CAA19328.1 ubiquitin-protein ligase E3 (predicted) [Schizosaccharomyces pombe]|eukprot:NP_596736.1 putative ubiquitin-protein ligase E3 [Schizosaccharomyces pombe]
MRKERPGVLFNKIRSYFICPGCNCLPDWPVTLPCGGTVCRKCFRNAYSSESSGKVSPSRCCFYNHKKPHYSVETEVKDVIISKVVELIKTTEFQISQQSLVPLELKEEICHDDCLSSSPPCTSALTEITLLPPTFHNLIPSSSSYETAVAEFLHMEDLLQENVSRELECQICFGMLYDPVVSPCGHTFCGPCLMQALTQSPQCPTCRFGLPSPVVLEHAKSHSITTFLRDFYPDNWLERQKSWEEEKEQESWLPLFISMLAYPRMPTFLHIFELRYHIMIKKCLETSKRFCIAMPLRARSDGHNEHRELRNARGQRLFCSEYGTILEIIQVEPLIDGRSLVEARGSYCVRIIDFRADGLFPRVKIEKHYDTPLRATPLQFPEPEYLLMYGNLSNEELVERIDAFYMNARRTYVHWVVPLIDIKMEARQSIADLSYKITNLLPISELEKTRILQVDNPTDRLVLVLIWLTQLQESWWYRVGSACTIA